MVNLTNAMKNLQESKQNESKKLAKIIEEQNLKKEGKSLKEDYEGNYDPAALNDDIELLEKVDNTLNEIWDIMKGGDSQFFSEHKDELAIICDSVSELKRKAKEIFAKEERDMLDSYAEDDEDEE